MKRNILVTAVGGRSVGSGILHALTKALPDGGNRWNVVAADADTFAWGLYKVNDAVLLPPARDADYLSAIHDVIGKYAIAAIVPGSEVEAEVLAGNKHLFEIPIIANSPELMPLMMDKFIAHDKLLQLGLPTIPTFAMENWEKATQEFDFPFILKPSVGSGGSRGVTMCMNLAELKQAMMKAPVNAGYCIQPVIGSDDSEYTVGILSDKNGKLIDSIVMKRKLMGLSLLDSKVLRNKRFGISTGYSQGYFVKDERIQSFCESLSAKIASKGPLNVQLRIHDEKVYVFEIHPRFSGTSTMRADLGFNEPDILLRNHLDGEEFGRIDYQYDVAAIRAFEHVIVPIRKML